MTNPGIFSNSDFENRGRGYQALPSRFTNSVTFNAGLQVQFSTVGITIDFDELRLGLDVRSDRDTLVINRVVGSIANSFLDDQLILGVGFRAVTFGLNQQLNGALQSFLSHSGANTQLGMILKPRWLPFRFGVTVRPELTLQTSATGITSTAAGKILPSGIVVPWEVEAGGVVELGKRPLNPSRVDATFVEQQIRARYEAGRAERAAEYHRRLDGLSGDARERQRRAFELHELDVEAVEDGTIDRELTAITDGERMRARLWDRQQMQVLFGVLVTGATANGVGITDFLAQQQVASGQTAVVSPRVAFETEPIPTWLRVRGGSYLEPARYAGSEPREHFTLGFDLRLLKFNPLGLFGDEPWQLRFAGDVSARYVNWAVGLGKYH